MMAMVMMRVRVTAASPITIHTTALPLLTVASLKSGLVNQLSKRDFSQKPKNYLRSDDLCTEAVRDPMSASPLT